MKDYWLVINPDSMSIEICFPNYKMNGINACLATLHLEQQEQLLKRLLEITRDTPPFTLSYEYFSLEIDPYNITYTFHMYHEEVRYFLFTGIFTEALGEYLVEMKKLIQSKM